MQMPGGGVQPDKSWSDGYEKQATLKITTVGRRTGQKHQVTIQFVADDGRLIATTRDSRRDWVRNVLKNPAVEVTIGGVTRKMTASVLRSDSEQATARNLYQKKYPLARLSQKVGSLFKASGEPQPIFELRPE